MATSTQDLGSGWTVTSSSSEVGGLSVGTDAVTPASGTPTSRQSVNFTADFTDANPITLTFNHDPSQISDLFDYIDPTIKNDSQQNWSGFTIQLLGPTPAVLGQNNTHPNYTHFHDSTNTSWVNPQTGLFTTVQGFDTFIPGSPASPSIDKENEASLSGAIFSRSTMQAWKEFGVHGVAANGSFTLVLTPTFNPPPVVAITSTGGLTNKPMQTVNGTVSVADAGTTVSVFDNGGSTAIGTATVQADGSWSAPVTLPTQGANSLVAQDTDSTGNTGNSAAVVYTLDQMAPVVGFTPPVTFVDTRVATLKGTVSDPLSPPVSLLVYDGSTVLGNATVNPDGTWTLANANLQPGTHSFSAVATDALGNVSPQTPLPVSLETGIHGAPYTSYEADFDGSGNLTGETFTKARGRVYLQDTVTNLPNGDHLIDYAGGTFFNTQTYFEKKDLFSADYSSVKLETLYNDDGTHTLFGTTSDLTLQSIRNDTMTCVGHRDTFKFAPHFGQDLVTDFHAAGAGHDVISLSSTDFSSIAQVLHHTHDVNGSAVIQVSPHDSVTVQNVTTAELKTHPKDFTLHA